MGERGKDLHIMEENGEFGQEWVQLGFRQLVREPVEPFVESMSLSSARGLDVPLS